MSRLLVSAAAIILTVTPALADGRNHATEASRASQPLEEETTTRGTPYSTSSAFGNAAHNAMENQQGASMTHSGATQTGISELAQ